MKKWPPVVARVLMGLLFTMSGVIAFASGFEIPPDLPEPLATFNKGLAASKFFVPLLKTVELACGLMLVSGYFVPLALTLLVPVVTGILLTHVFIAPETLPVAIVLAVLETYLVFFTEYGKPVRALLRPKVN